MWQAPDNEASLEGSRILSGRVVAVGEAELRPGSPGISPLHCPHLLSSPSYSLASMGGQGREEGTPMRPAWTGGGIVGESPMVRTPCKRDSMCTVFSSVASTNHDGNPFAHEVNLIEFALMLQVCSCNALPVPQRS